MGELIEKIFGMEAFWGLAGTAIGGTLTLWGQRYLKRVEDKQKVYGTLVGIKHLLKQLYVSRFEAWIFSDFYEQRNRLRGGNHQLSLDEARRQMYKSEDLIHQIMIAERELKECFGMAVCSFSLNSDELKTLEGLVNHPVPKIFGNPTEITDENNLDTWKAKAVAELQKKVDEIFDESFKESAEMLRKKL